MSHVVGSTSLSLGKSARDLACQVHCHVDPPFSTLYFQEWYKEEKVVAIKQINGYLLLK